MRKKITRYICAFLAMLMLLGTISAEPVAAAVPSINAPVTVKNVLSLLQAYDKDAAYILNTMSKSGDNILEWWLPGQSLTEGIDTAVHEETHRYTSHNASWNSENIFIGNKKAINVPYTDIFPSSVMGKKIPKDLRTDRWGTYVGNPMPYTGSDVDGIYGLLDEFTAYYWGMHASISLFDYYKKCHATADQWFEFLNACANGRQAYAEFKYYSLNYMVYAKQHNKKVYKGILNNKNYIKAFTTIEKRYASLIKKFDNRIEDVAEILRKEGHEVRIMKPDGANTAFFIDNHGTSLLDAPYLKLVKEMKKSKYQKILSAMKK